MSDGTLGSPAARRSRFLADGAATSLWRWYAAWSIPVAFVLVFLKVDFQPALTLRGASADPADLAILLALVAALLRLREEGLEALHGSRPLWLAAVAFLLFVTAASLYPRISDGDYAWKAHLVTAAKFGEYALLAPATAVLVRDARALRRLLATVVALALAAALVGVVQFAGAGIFRAWPPGDWREPSFAGLPELATLGGAALAIAFVGLLWPHLLGRRMLLVAVGAGAVCVVVPAAAEGGIALAAIAVAAVALVGARAGVTVGGAAKVAAVAVACALGLVALRGGDIAQFGRFVGVLRANPATSRNVQTYAQRTLMYYIGLRVFEAHPLFGAGWQSIRETQVYSPFLAAARRAFPNQPAQAFPSPAHTWAIDDAYIQSLAELGALGTALFLCLLLTGLRLGVVRALRGPPAEARVALVGVLWLLVAMGIWCGQGLVAGIAFEALAWFGIGLIAAGRALPPQREPSAVAA